jgi:hypothetical protein
MQTAMKRWEIIADNLGKVGWSWGCISAIDREGRTIWIADAHRGDGKRFVVRSEDKLTAFVELESGDSPDQRRTSLGYETALSNSICAASQPSRVKRNRVEKLLSRHRERPPPPG